MPNVDWESAWKDAFPPGYPKWKSIDMPSDMFPPDIVSKFKEIELKPGLLRVFKWKQQMVFPWHVDGASDFVCKVALNWVPNRVGKVQWNEGLKLPTDTTGITAGIIHGKITDPYTCESEDSANGCLLKIDIPHRVYTMGFDEPRHSLSMMFAKSDKRSYDELARDMRSVGLIQN